MTEDSARNIKEATRVVLLLSRLQISVQDRFFKESLGARIADLLNSFLEMLLSAAGNDVAQYRLTLERSLVSAERSLELLKELQYLKIINHSPLLLSVEQDLLALKLGILRRRAGLRLDKKIVKPPVVEAVKNIPVVRENKPEKLTGSKKQILDFIKKYPEIRTKDIIYEFNALSGRTIKRNLTELLRTGFVKKRIDNKAVYYSTAE